MFRTRQRTETQFKEVGTTSVFVSETKANHSKSMALLQENGLRPMTYQEALVKIDQNPELKAQLKGKGFYLDGKGLKGLEFYTSFDNEGKLTEDRRDTEKTVCAFLGENPLSLSVGTDYDALYGERRFNLSAFEDPQSVAPVVVGVRAGPEVAVPKVEAHERKKSILNLFRHSKK